MERSHAVEKTERIIDSLGKTLLDIAQNCHSYPGAILRATTYY